MRSPRARNYRSGSRRTWPPRRSCTSIDDWPFAAGKGGGFDARAHVGGASLKFNRDWPQGEQMEIDLAFFGPGFSLSGSGELLGNHVRSVAGGIDSFHEPWRMAKDPLME